MKLTRHTSAEAFLRHAGAFLGEQEAAHNLLLGLTSGLIDGVVASDGPPYLATVADDSGVCAAALRTPPYSVVVSLAPPEAAALLADDLHASDPALPGVNGPSDVALAFAHAFRARTGRRFARARAMRIYQVDRVVPVSGVSGELRRATMADRDIALEWGRAFNQETSGVVSERNDARILDMLGDSADRALYIWDDGGPVSICGSSGPTPNGIRISYVYTPPHLRGRGYASAATAALSQHLLDAGYRFCFLYTDLDNPTSNRIYQRIGYRPVIDADEYLFEPVE